LNKLGDLEVANFLQVFENGLPIASLCGDNIPSPVVAQGNTITVKFTSDSSVAYSGFSASYSGKSNQLPHLPKISIQNGFSNYNGVGLSITAGVTF